MSGQSILVLVISATSLLMIILGWYIHKAKAYHLIAGFNTLSQEEKKKMDMKKFVRVFRNVFFLMGFTMILTYPILSWLGYEKYTSLVAVFVIVIGAVFLNYKRRDFFNKARKETKPF